MSTIDSPRLQKGAKADDSAGDGKLSGKQLHDHSGRALPFRLHAADNMSIADARGFDSLRQPVGWISDERDSWRLWYSGITQRSDAAIRDFDLYWCSMEYMDRGERKKKGNIADVSPVTVCSPLPTLTPRDKKFIASLNGSQTCSFEEWSRLSRLMSPHVTGIWTLEGREFPRFQIEKWQGVVRIRLEPFTTARSLLRIIELAMMRRPEKPSRDSNLEPFLNFVAVISAMDEERFGLAAALCSERYVKSFAVAVPEPFRSILLARVAETVQELKPRTSKSDLLTDKRGLESWVNTGPDEGLISIDQIQIDLPANLKVAGVATTPRRLEEKIRRCGVAVRKQRGVGKFISLRDYRRIKGNLLVHGNERPSNR